MQYNKPHKTVAQQIKILKNRGMVIKEEEQAIQFLTHVSYYRLRAYWYIYENEEARSQGKHEFEDNVYFEDIVKLYLFDKAFRLLILDAIEKIEVSVRSNWTYFMSNACGPFGYLENENNKPTANLDKNRNELRSEVGRSRESFIAHFIKKYGDEHKLPPIWMASEIMSFSLLSKWYKDVYPYKVKKDIAKTYNVQHGALDNILEHLSYIRNICAHHGRLWNRHLLVTLSIRSKHSQNITKNFNQLNDANIYNSLVTIIYFVNQINPQWDWLVRLKSLIDEYDPPLEKMGFPDDWKTLPIWQ